MDLVSDYLDNSSIHGFKYIGDKTRPWFERILWVVIFLISFFGCCKLIFDVHQKFDQNPVIVTFDEKPTSISEIPFPAVTICPATKSQKKLFDVTKMFYNLMNKNFRLYDLNGSDIAKVAALSQVCFEKAFFNVDPMNLTNCDGCVQTLKEIGKPKEDMLIQCDFVKESSSCEDLFEETITDEGICFTFNDLKGSIPRRVKGAGNEFSLELTLQLCRENFDYICRGPSQGFKVLLHDPGEIPQLRNNFYRVPLNKELIIAIKPQVLTTTDGLRQYSPKKRQCFFNSEKNLQFYDVYTERNCKLECLANFTLQKCGCVKFYMPRLDSTKICGLVEIKCSIAAFRERHYLEVIQDLQMAENPYDCNCLPACTSITYDAEISQTDSYMEEYYEALNKNPKSEINGCQQSRIAMFFKEENFLSTKRSELYGWTDFLANCGGLLGLFMGVSIMSILEIFYFCTVRIICNVMKQQDSGFSNDKIIFID